MYNLNYVLMEGKDILKVVVTGPAVKRWLSELKDNNIKFDKVGQSYEVENGPKTRMAIRMVTENHPRQITVTNKQ